MFVNLVSCIFLVILTARCAFSKLDVDAVRERIQIICSEQFVVCPPIENLKQGSYGGGTTAKLVINPDLYGVGVFKNCPPASLINGNPKCSEKHRIPSSEGEITVFIKYIPGCETNQDKVALDKRRGVKAFDKELYRSRRFASLPEGALGIDLIDVIREKSAENNGDQNDRRLFKDFVIMTAVAGIEEWTMLPPPFDPNKTRVIPKQLTDCLESASASCEEPLERLIAEIALGVRNILGLHHQRLAVIRFMNFKNVFHCDFHSSNWMLLEKRIPANDKAALRQAFKYFQQGYIAPAGWISEEAILYTIPWDELVEIENMDSLTVQGITTDSSYAIDTAYALRFTPKEIARAGGYKKIMAPCWNYRTMRQEDIGQWFRISTAYTHKIPAELDHKYLFFVIALIEWLISLKASINPFLHNFGTYTFLCCSTDKLQPYRTAANPKAVAIENFLARFKQLISDYEYFTTELSKIEEFHDCSAYTKTAWQSTAYLTDDISAGDVIRHHVGIRIPWRCTLADIRKAIIEVQALFKLSLLTFTDYALPFGFTAEAFREEFNHRMFKPIIFD